MAAGESDGTAGVQEGESQTRVPVGGLHFLFR